MGACSHGLGSLLRLNYSPGFEKPGDPEGNPHRLACGGVVKTQKGHTVVPVQYECDAIIQYINFIC